MGEIEKLKTFNGRNSVTNIINTMAERYGNSTLKYNVRQVVREECADIFRTLSLQEPPAGASAAMVRT